MGIGRRVPGAGTGGGLGEVRSSHHRRLDDPRFQLIYHLPPRIKEGVCYCFSVEMLTTSEQKVVLRLVWLVLTGLVHAMWGAC